MRVKGDERILGDGDFVEEVLQRSQEELGRKYRLEAQGYDFDWSVDQVAQVTGVDRKEVLSVRKYPHSVKARSLLCYWATRKLGLTTVALSKKLKIAQPTVSQSVKRGGKIAPEEGLNMSGENNQ